MLQPLATQESSRTAKTEAYSYKRLKSATKVEVPQLFGRYCASSKGTGYTLAKYTEREHSATTTPGALGYLVGRHVHTQAVKSSVGASRQ